MKWFSRAIIPIVGIVIFLFAISLLSSPLLVNYCGITLLKSFNNKVPTKSICLDQDSSIHQRLLSSGDGRYLLSISSHWQGDWETAERYILTEDIQTDFLASYWLGYYYYQQGKTEQAITVWKSNQPFVDGIWELAKDHVLIEGFDEAIRLYQLATLLMPDNAELWLEYGKVLWNTKFKSYEQNIFLDDELTQEMKKAFSRAVSLNPIDYESLDRYAWYLYIIEEDYIHALDYLLNAWDQGGSDDPWVNYHLGRVNEDLKDDGEAKRFYQIAFHLNPAENLLIPNRFTQFLIRTGENNAAIEVIEKVLLPADSNNPVQYLRLVLLYIDQCEIQKAIDYLREAEELDVADNLSLLKKAREEVANTSCNSQ